MRYFKSKSLMDSLSGKSIRVFTIRSEFFNKVFNKEGGK